MPDTDAGLWCIVPAAGRSARFGGPVSKQYLALAGEPMLLCTLRRLAAHPRIAGLMVVLAADDKLWPNLADLAGKPVQTAIGGTERAASVLAGLKQLPANITKDKFILVHDAARPCVRIDDISRLIDAAWPAGGGLLATPLRDTLKRADGAGRVGATEPRQSRWRALTPQLFRRGELEMALDSAIAAGIEVTDEAMAMERAGHRPLLVEGSQDNIKITTPADLALAESILARQACA